MSTNKDYDVNEEKFSFIQEKVAPRAKNTKKKLLRTFGMTVLLAIIFGFISSFVFYITNQTMEKWENQEQKEPIVLEDELEESTPLITGVEEEQEVPNEPATKSEITDQDIFRALNIKSYQKLFNLMRNMAENMKYSMVTVLKVSNISNWFEMEKNEENYGLILSIEQDYIYVLCNYSYIKGANKIKVAFYNNEIARAELVDYDKETKLAIVKVKVRSATQRTKSKIVEAELGDSYQLSYGVPVLGLGAPDGTMYSMQIGYITAPCIDKYIVDGKLGFYHTSIAENAYGEGFFINMDGKVIGIITHDYKEESDESIMCFLGISKLKAIIERMLNNQSKAYLGVKVSELSSDVAEKLNVSYGIYVTDVIANSPAFKKGLKGNDVITEIDGTSVSSVAGLMSKIEEHKPGDTMTFKITRQVVSEYLKTSFEEKTITVKLEEE